ncbi:unnamed protein product [Rhodiola kirilowii]
MELITQKPHAVVVASPGMGHLTPFLELVKRLVSHHGFQVTLFAVIADSSTVQSQILSSTNRDFLHVRVIHLDVSSEVPQDADVSHRVVATMQKAMPGVKSAISNMKVCPNLLIADLFGTDYWAVADEFGMLKFAFMTTSASFLALAVFLPVFEDVEDSDYIPVPGCDPVWKFDKRLTLTKDSPAYLGLVCAAKRISMSDGIIVNSWRDLEPKAIESLSDPNLLGRLITGRVYPVGPLVKQPSIDHEPALASRENHVFKWLQNQPDQSVLYISFGSGGSLTFDQIQELAFGLELSQQRFIWVLRPPSDIDASKFFFSVDVNEFNGSNYLPTGFLSSTKEVGLIVPMWAPQAEILRHNAIGGFLTHCGWNSIIESVVNGVPMVAWPLYAEQGLNATMLTEDLKIAVKPEALTGEEDLVRREEIEKAIKKIMADKGSYVIRERVMKLKNDAAKAGASGKGSTNESLSEFTKFVCTMKMK